MQPLLHGYIEYLNRIDTTRSNAKWQKDPKTPFTNFIPLCRHVFSLFLLLLFLFPFFRIVSFAHVISLSAFFSCGTFSFSFSVGLLDWCSFFYFIFIHFQCFLNVYSLKIPTNACAFSAKRITLAFHSLVGPTGCFFSFSFFFTMKNSQIFVCRLPFYTCH